MYTTTCNFWCWGSKTHQWIIVFGNKKLILLHCYITVKLDFLYSQCPGLQTSVVLLLLLVMRGCWTVSCRHRLTKITLTLLAYHGPSGPGSSSLVCLRVPWYTWGLIGCVKFSLCVCVALSQLLILSVTESGGDCDPVFVCVWNHPGHSEKRALMD